jgi:hypothetical protein
MKPIDFRLATFAELKTRLAGQREAVLRAWQRHGPGTTAAVCMAAGMSILTFRPRTTELFQLGFLCVLERGCYIALGSDTPVDRGGVYRIRTDVELLAWFDAQRAASTPHQAELAFR